MPDSSETPARSTSLDISHFSEDEILMMILGLMSCEPGIQEMDYNAFAELVRLPCPINTAAADERQPSDFANSNIASSSKVYKKLDSAEETTEAMTARLPVKHANEHATDGGDSPRKRANNTHVPTTPKREPCETEESTMAVDQSGMLKAEDDAEAKER